MWQPQPTSGIPGVAPPGMSSSTPAPPAIPGMSYPNPYAANAYATGYYNTTPAVTIPGMGYPTTAATAYLPPVSAPSIPAHAQQQQQPPQQQQQQQQQQPMVKGKYGRNRQNQQQSDHQLPQSHGNEDAEEDDEDEGNDNGNGGKSKRLEM